ncbi:hypothetical protein ACFPLB_14705 [Aquamicrobium segne]|uniref:Uncharacterized protein n=1 Tax=Aquamicrobium segne TaxID=469547 RepID=A0ABW0H1Q3_9HYPH
MKKTPVEIEKRLKRFQELVNVAEFRVIMKKIAPLTSLMVTLICPTSLRP